MPEDKTTPKPAPDGGFTPNPLLSDAAQDHAQSLYDDWTQYVAAQDIPDPFGGTVLAYAAGHPVPASNVKRWQYDQQGLVHKVSTKAGQDAAVSLAPRTPATIKAPGD